MKSPSHYLRVMVCCAGGLMLTATGSRAQTLAVSRDHFTVNGTAQFLVFASYFHGLDRPAAMLSADLAWLKSKGVIGVRVWPNVSQPRLMNEDGQLNSVALDKLRFLIGEASARGMIVDVTFTREHIAGDFSMGEYQQAIASAASDLRDRRNILFDLQNEWNCWSNQREMTIAALENIRAAVKAAVPALVVTASTSCHPYGEAGANAFDVLSHHGPRDRFGNWANDTGDLVRDLKWQVALTPGRVAPVYLQEPNRFGYPFDRLDYYDSTPSHYWTSVQAAKREGAAAWTFHTAASFNMTSSTPFSALLLDGERAVLDGLASALAAQPTWGIKPPIQPPSRFRRRWSRGCTLRDGLKRRWHVQPGDGNATPLVIGDRFLAFTRRGQGVAGLRAGLSVAAVEAAAPSRRL